MPSKVQLKLLSNSGELLHLVTCHAGKISVLRATSPSELRPYQRALGGSSAKDNLEVMCDGIAYNPDEHIVIGFAEQGLRSGLTVREFLSSQGVSEVAINSLLLSIGLDGLTDKKCSELSSDQEGRLQLAAATTSPNKVVVLNDPFEHISSQWRERCAEMLSDFVRTRGALVIIPALSYRPECWIDNQHVERIEVGQTSQRTIGFGSAGSATNSLMQDLRDKVRANARGQNESSSDHHRSYAAAAGIAAIPTDDGLMSLPSQTQPHSRWTVKATRIVSILAGVGVGGVLAVLLPTLQSTSVAPTKSFTKMKIEDTSQRSTSDANSAASQTAPLAQPAHSGEAPSRVPARISAERVETKEEFVLDRYPSLIRASIVSSARGAGSQNNQHTTSGPVSKDKQPHPPGNLFSLLERAGSEKGDPLAAQRPAWVQDSYQQDSGMVGSDDSGESAMEEQRREEIRARFLEAIQAAAARRQAAMEADSDE